MNPGNTSRKRLLSVWKSSSSIRLALASFAVLFGAVASRGGGVVSNCAEADLRTALAGGGLVTFDCDGVLNLANTLTITNNTTIDAAGHNIVLNVGPVIQPVRLVQINPGVTLALNHLVLANGVARGTNATANNTRGGNGSGGAVWNNAGTLIATDCVFSNNIAVGGTGGPATVPIASNFGGAAQGGAIFNDSGTLSLTNVLFIANSAKGGTGGSAPQPGPSAGGSGGTSAGGAVYCNTGLVTMVSCQFLSNSAPASLPGQNNGYQPNSGPAVGGAAYFGAGTNMILNSRFEKQSVGGGQYFCNAQAGAIYQIAGALRLLGCSFATNKVTGGDGIIIGSGSNAGSADGGALLVATLGTGEQGQTKIYCDAVVSNSCFVGNSVKGGLQGPAVGSGGTASGGAIESSSRLQMFNCTIAGNSASGGDITYFSYPMSSAYGGALYVFLGSTSILTHVTIANNSVSRGAGAGSGVAQGGGIYVSSSRVSVRNSILSSNAPANCSGTLVDDGRSISSDASCAFAFSGSMNNTDPKLLPLGFYGGPTLTFLPRSGSPAIDAAHSAFLTPTDQRGVPRPQCSAGDIGAVEANALTVQKSSDGILHLNQGAPAGATCTLQVSTNFADWTDLQTVTADLSGWAIFSITNLDSAAAFFRAVEVP